ncbi:MAG: SDR family oxidoreductase [Synechococcales cyanobacterium]
MDLTPRTVLVIGASRGIGAAVTQHLAALGHRVFAVSRTPAAVGHGIPADISTPQGLQSIKAALGDTPLDALLFMGGVWEEGAFTEAYDFARSTDAETRWVIAVNTIAPIELTRLLADNLAATANPRAIYMGSRSGLDHCASVEVANTASKFGLRGAVQALRLALADRRYGQKIGFTVINPGNVATAEVLLDIAEGRFPPQQPIPMADLLATIDWLMGLSPMVDVPEVNLFQR